MNPFFSVQFQGVTVSCCTLCHCPSVLTLLTARIGSRLKRDFSLLIFTYKLKAKDYFSPFTDNNVNYRELGHLSTKGILKGKVTEISNGVTNSYKFILITR